LKYDCNRPSIIFSSIGDEDIKVTVADIAAILKCHAEPPEGEPWIVCPSILTTKDIVLDMCQGQFTDRHKNAASKAKLPPQLVVPNTI
jgi:hypothetical protein